MPHSARLVRAAYHLRTVFDSWVAQHSNLTALRLCMQHCGSGSSSEIFPSTRRPAFWIAGESKTKVEHMLGWQRMIRRSCLIVFARLQLVPMPAHHAEGKCRARAPKGHPCFGHLTQRASAMHTDSSSGLLPFLLKRSGISPNSWTCIRLNASSVTLAGRALLTQPMTSAATRT